MTSRILDGDIGGGNFVFRVSKPGFNVETEPFGSAGISFDSRLSDIGTVVASGLVQCGGSAVSFPTMPYVPIVRIFPWDGLRMNAYNVKAFFNGQLYHTWRPAIAIVTDSSIRVVAYTNPFFNTLGFYNPNGQYYVYSVYAAG